LKDGETQILAGLIGDIDRTTANKVPGLGELPIAGRLFGSQKDEAERTEILLSITPRIVRSIRRPDLRAAEFASGTEANIGAQPLHLRILEPEKTDAKAPAAPTSAVSPRPALAENSPQPAVTPPVTAVAPPAAGAVVGPAVSLSWQSPAQIKLGEQFSAVLRVNTQGALRGLPLLVGFDPQLLQVVGLQEGDFFKQGGAAISFSQRIDPAQGKVFVATVRQGAAGSDPGINGTGGLVTVTFKAIKAGAARVQLLSASPEPASALASPLPIDQLIKVVP
jgi:general secretion pathway protein D